MSETLQATQSRVTATMMPTPATLVLDGSEFRTAWLVTIRAATKAGDVSGLYYLLYCGPQFARVVKVAAKPDVYQLTLEGGRAVACTCQAASYRPDAGLCKHGVAWNQIFHPEDS